jgi:4-hydroxy-2-oxoheptanedioate aldolase
MRSSKILAQLRAGQVAWICSLGFPASNYPALAARAGYHGVWMDGEHHAWDPREIEAMLLRHRLADIDCLWRPPTRERATLYRLLEDGATGLMLPHIPSAEVARELAQAVKFPPLGDRGLGGSGLDADYLVGDPKAYAAHANRETFLVVQIETPGALENAAAIAAMPSVDALFIRPADLSLRLGCGAGATDPRLSAAQEAIAAAARQHGKAWGRPVGTIEEARAIIGQGAQLVAFGSAFSGLSRMLDTCARERGQLSAG